MLQKVRTRGCRAVLPPSTLQQRWQQARPARQRSALRLLPTARNVSVFKPRAARCSRATLVTVETGVAVTACGHAKLWSREARCCRCAKKMRRPCAPGAPRRAVAYMPRRYRMKWKVIRGVNEDPPNELQKAATALVRLRLQVARLAMVAMGDGNNERGVHRS